MAANQRLAAIGNYEVSSLTIGEGSFSKVKIARHRVLEKNVAIKIINLSTIKDPYVSRNLEREAKILSTLTHTNVVRLFEVARCEGFYCLIMEYLPGGSLCDMIQKNGKIDENTARRFFGQLITGLGYIHGKGIVHRDLKLENLLLSKDLSNLVIADFGLSNFWSLENKLNTYCGSPEYAAPELFDKAVYDQKIDVWSAGIILYCMLTAQLPFDVNPGVKGHISALVKIIKLGLGSRHRLKLSHCSLELKILLQKMLRVNPEKRIDVEGILVDPWITDNGLNPLQEAQELTLSEEETQLVTKKCKLVLTLTKVSSQQVLSHIRSDKGWFGKTAGCFNILRREMEHTRTSNVPTLHPVHVKEPLFKPSERLEDISRNQFWDSTPGKRALHALVKINPSSPQIRPPQSKIRRTGEQEGAGSVQVYESEEPCSTNIHEKEKTGKGRTSRNYSRGFLDAELDKENINSSRTEDTLRTTGHKEKNYGRRGLGQYTAEMTGWRRSVKPQSQGEEKNSRLKRVDWGDKEPLKSWNMNRI